MRTFLTILILCASVFTSRAASTILAVTPSGDTSEDKRIFLSNSQCARTWSTSLGTNWTKVRVALRIIMTNVAFANITGTPKFAVGICAGTNNVFQHATCSNWVGVVSSSATWTMGSSGTTNANFANVSFLASTKVGATVTNFTACSTTTDMMADSGAMQRSLFFVDITKGAGTNFTVGGFSRTATTQGQDTTYDTFLIQAETASPTHTLHTAMTAVQVPVDEAVNGYLNTVNVAWSVTTPGIHISDVYVTKLQ